MFAFLNKLKRVNGRTVVQLGKGGGYTYYDISAFLSVRSRDGVVTTSIWRHVPAFVVSYSRTRWTAKACNFPDCSWSNPLQCFDSPKIRTTQWLAQGGLFISSNAPPRPWRQTVPGPPVKREFLGIFFHIDLHLDGRRRRRRATHSMMTFKVLLSGDMLTAAGDRNARPDLADKAIWNIMDKFALDPKCAIGNLQYSPGTSDRYVALKRRTYNISLIGYWTK